MVHVLYVEDDPSVAVSAKDLLTEFGHTVTHYKDAESALSAFRKSPEKFDVILSDQSLGVEKMVGTEFAQAVFQTTEATTPPFILTTSQEWDELRERHSLTQETPEVGRPIAGYLQKPLKGKDIIGRINMLTQDQVMIGSGERGGRK